MPKCPFCDYEGEKNSIIGHATSKTDEAHKGVGGQQVKAMLEANETVNSPAPPTEAEQAPPDNSGQADEPSVQEATEDPAAGGPPDDRDPEDDLHCPDCGPRGELVDYRGTNKDPEAGFPTPDDFYCVECGQGWNE